MKLLVSGLIPQWLSDADGVFSSLPFLVEAYLQLWKWYPQLLRLAPTRYCYCWKVTLYPNSSAQLSLLASHFHEGKIIQVVSSTWLRSLVSNVFQQYFSFLQICQATPASRVWFQCKIRNWTVIKSREYSFFNCLTRYRRKSWLVVCPECWWSTRICSSKLFNQSRIPLIKLESSSVLT